MIITVWNNLIPIIHRLDYMQVSIIFLLKIYLLKKNFNVIFAWFSVIPFFPVYLFHLSETSRSEFMYL